MGRSEIAASIRTRAELARSLATALSEPNAVKAPHEIAAALDEEADKLDGDIVTKPPLNDS